MLSGQPLSDPSEPNPAQQSCLQHIVESCTAAGKCPAFSPAGAFAELCGQRAPYLSMDGGPAAYNHSVLSLPSGSSPLVLCAENFPEDALNLLQGGDSGCYALPAKPPWSMHLKVAPNPMLMPLFEVPPHMPNSCTNSMTGSSLSLPVKVSPT